MKKSFFVFFSIALLLIGASITFSWRGFDNGRWTNRDDQTETSGVLRGRGGPPVSVHWTKRVGLDSDGQGIIKTESLSRINVSVFCTDWAAYCSISNIDPTLTKGNWDGFAVVPNTDPDEDYKYNVNGIVNESFSRYDMDWLAYFRDTSIDDCSAWAYISMFDGVNNIAYDSYSHVPF